VQYQLVEVFGGKVHRAFIRMLAAKVGATCNNANLTRAGYTCVHTIQPP
jgi:hypothetical protein